jgi:hypothetical protein
MDPWYDLHSWSKQYRQEALREASERSLVERARSDASPHAGRSRANRIRKHALSLLRAAHLTQ